MNTTSIPQHILSLVRNAVAERNQMDISKVVMDKVSEEEFLAALAYVQGIPLFEADDICEESLTECRRIVENLEVDALADYGFAPIAIRGQTIVVVSRAPWDPDLAEVIGSYFLQCSRVRYILASPAVLSSLFAQLKGTASKETPKAGYVPRGAVPKAPVPTIPTPSAPTATKPTPTVPTPPRTGTAPVTVPTPAKTGPVAPVPGQPSILTTEETVYLLNILVAEANKLLRQKSGK